MSIKPVRPHSEACSVWLSINLLNEIRKKTMSGNVFYIPETPKEAASMERSRRTIARSRYMAWDSPLPPSLVHVASVSMLSVDVKRCGLTVKAWRGGARHGASPWLKEERSGQFNPNKLHLEVGKCRVQRRL